MLSFKHPVLAAALITNLSIANPIATLVVACPIAILSIVPIAIITTSDIAWADDSVSIFDVRKNLPLEPSETIYHDYYLNAGPEAGLKKGMYVTVVRKLPIHDPLQNKAQGTLTVEVARVQIVHVERNISVARLVDDVDTEFRPILDFEGIMIGDTLDLTTISNEGPKLKKGSKSSASTAPESEVPPATRASAATAPPETETVILPAPKLPEKDTGSVDRKVDSVVPPASVENKPSKAAPVPDMVGAAHEPNELI